MGKITKLLNVVGNHGSDRGDNDDNGIGEEDGAFFEGTSLFLNETLSAILMYV